MPASGGKDVMSKAELQQRQEAPLKHGAYAKNLPVPSDGLETRAAVVEAVRIRARRAIKMADVVASYVAARVNNGEDLDSIAALGRLPAFQNSAARLLAQLYDILPNDERVVDVETVLRAYSKGEDDETDGS